MKIWEVTTKYYDDGKVKAQINILDVSSKPINWDEDTGDADIYHEYFTSENAAKIALQQYIDEGAKMAVTK